MDSHDRDSAKCLRVLAVFTIDRKAGKMTLIELAPGVTLDELKSKTAATYTVSPALKQME